MARRGNHRLDWKDAGRQSAQQHAYHMAKLFAAVRMLHEIIRSIRPLAPRTDELEPTLVARARRVDEDAWPYMAIDEGGRV